jgi:hypothetical protein
MPTAIMTCSKQISPSGIKEKYHVNPANPVKYVLTQLKIKNSKLKIALPRSFTKQHNLYGTKHDHDVHKSGHILDVEEIVI